MPYTTEHRTNKEKFEIDRLLDRGEKTVDLYHYPKLAWEMFWAHYDPVIVKEVSNRIDEVVRSLIKKRDGFRKAQDKRRMAGYIASYIENSLFYAFIDTPQPQDIPCLRVVKAASGCYDVMCREIVEHVLNIEINRAQLAKDAISENAPKSDSFRQKFEAYNVDSMIRSAFQDFYNNLKERQYAVDLETRKVIPWPEEKKQKD